MKYTFFKDELGTIWYRDCIIVEADSYEEAKENIIKIINGDDIDDEIEHEYDYSEPLYDTWVETSLSDNLGYTTIEIEDAESNTIIYRNGV